jgi:LysR family transcriptional regulator of abg operon
VKFNQLQAFLMVVEHKSIRGAARALALTQPAVSKTMHDLEQELGVPLIYRSSNGIELTEYGEVLTVRASLLMQEIRRTRESLESIRDGASGRVTMVVSSTVALTVLPQAFADFHAQFPKVEVEFFEGSLSFSRSRLRDGTLDFIVANLPAGIVEDEFDAHIICTVGNVIGVRQSYAAHTAQSLRDLGQSTWLMPGSQRGGKELLSALFEQQKLPVPERVIPCQSLTVALGLMENMDIVSIFARPLAEREFKRHGLKILQIREPLPTTSLAIITRKGSKMTFAARKFADALTTAGQALMS